MRKFMPKVVLILILVLAICSTSAVVMAEPSVSTAEPTRELKIMHITDTHYIPTYYCYTGPLEENDFATKIKGDPKLMLESYAVLVETLRMIEESDVDYVLLTGDITSNGEKQSLIDVANSLRLLQNKMRKKNPNFQILAVPGNHDVFNNRHASFYNTEDGKKVPAGIASRKEFVKIFASLGFPDISDEEAREFYTDEEWLRRDKHLPYDNGSDIAFVNSTNRSDLKFDYYVEDTKDDVDAVGGLSYICYDDVFKASFAGFDTNLSVRNDQRTEGEFQKKNIDWYTSKDFTGYTQIIMGHHNIINHHPLQEQYTPKFVSFAWEEAAERLASHGVTYSFTGHFHANDIASYTSFNNNVLYDIETGATISQGSAIRKVNIKTFQDGSEDLESTLYPIKEADFSYLLENNLVPKGYEDCFNGNKVDVQKYINAKLFGPYLENMVDSFIGPTKINKMIDDLGAKSINVGPIHLNLDITEIVRTLIDTINTKVLNDYTYTGDIDSLKLPENKYIGYLHELLSAGIKTEVASGGHTFEELVIFAYGQHLMGAEATCFEELPDWVQEAMTSFMEGDNMDKILDAILFKDKALYSIVEGLAKTPIDLTLCKNSIASIRSVVKVLGLDVELDNVVIDTLVPTVLKNNMIKNLLGEIDLPADTLIGSVNWILDAYFNDAVKHGIGTVLCDIALSFATDTSYDGKFDETIVFKANASDAHSFNGYGKAKIEPTRANGRVPANLTVTFGADPMHDKNFVWTTSQYAPNGEIQYRKAGMTAWESKTASSVLLPYSATMFDLGIYSSKIDKNITRHNVRLTGLEAGTKYEYRVGDSTRDVWTEVGSFVTAKESGAFEVNVFGDLQGMDNSTYAEALALLEKSNKVFDGENADFVINLGDFVDDGKNSNQWGFFLDTIAPYWMHNTMAPVIGNHEGKNYTSGKTKDRKKGTNISVEEMTYSPFDFHFDMGALNAKKYYSFDYQGVHFIMLDTEDTDKAGNMNTSQVTWLENDLKNAKSEFVVVSMHKGIYSAGSHSNAKEVVAMRKQLAPIFYANKVDIVLEGHDHIYSETPLLDGNGVEASDGVKYITMGAMGDKLFKYVENENVPVAFGPSLHDGALLGQTFGKLSFDGTKLDYQGYIFDENGNAVKVEEYVKPSDRPANTNNATVWIVVGVVAGVAVIGAIIAIVVSKNKKKAKPQE